MASQSRSPILDPRLSAPALRASGVFGAIGLVFLIAMYVAFAVGARSSALTLGWINDVSAVITTPLALPGMLALHDRIRPGAGRAGGRLLVLGIGSSIAIAILQLLLVTGVLTFEQEAGPVVIAYLGFGAWLVLTGRIAQRQGILPGGTRLGAFAAVYVGYPVWAFRLARTLETEPEPLGEPAAA